MNNKPEKGKYELALIMEKGKPDRIGLVKIKKQNKNGKFKPRTNTANV